MSKPNVAGIILGGVIVACIAFVVVLFLIKALWAWTVPDLFPGAVLTGLVAKTLSWWAAFKLAVFVAFLAAVTGVRHSHKD